MPSDDVEVMAVFAHNHSFTYSVDSNAPHVLKATCIEGCPDGYHDDPLKLTLTAPSDFVYNGTAKEVIFASGEVEKWSSLAAELGNVPTVTYAAKDGSSLTDDKAVNAGDYTASITVSDTTAHLDFTIQKVDSSVTKSPTANEGLVYDGTPLELVTAGTAEGGTMEYSLDGENYSTDIPTGTQVKEYTVYYMVKGDINHNDFPAQTIPVSIGKAVRPETYASVAAYNYHQEAPLPTPSLTPALTDSPKVTYYYNKEKSNAGGTEWSKLTAKTLKEGIYYIYAVIDTTDNYQEYTTAPKEFTVTQAAPPIQITDANVITKIGKNGNVSEIVSDHDGCRLTETVRDEAGAVLVKGDYDKKVEKTDGEKSIDYKVTYTFTGNYTGTVVKKISVAKPSKEPDPEPDPSYNPNDDISTRVDKEKAEKYTPVVEEVPESKVRSVIINDLEKQENQVEIEKQLKAAWDESKTEIETVEQLVKELGKKGSNRNVSIESNLVLEVEAKSEETISEPIDVTLIKEAVESINRDSEIGYLDISMYVTYTLYEKNEPIVEMSKQKVTDTQALGEGKNFESTITIDVPISMRSNIPQNMRRTYYVGRVHEREYTELTHTTDTRITFKTGKFSTYALFYKDSEIPKEEPSNNGSNDQNAVVVPAAIPGVVMLAGYSSPKTGDSYEIYIWAGLLLMGLGLMALGARKKKTE